MVQDLWFATILLLTAAVSAALYLLASRKNRRLARENKRLTTALRAAGDTVWEWDIVGDRIHFSPRLMKLLGLGPDEPFLDFSSAHGRLHPDDKEDILIRLQRFMESDEDFLSLDYRLKVSEGGYRWVSLHGGVLSRSLGGKPRRMAGTLRDTTRRKTLEAQILESEARYRGIVEDQTELICRFTPEDGILSFVNESYARYFQSTREKLEGTSFFDLVPDESLPEIRGHLTTLAPSTPSGSYEHPVIMPDGSKRWHHWTDRLIVGTDGEPTEVQSVGRDVTMRVLAEQALRETEARYRGIFDNAPLCICRTLVTGGLVEINSEGARMHGYGSPAEMIREITDLAHQTYADPEERAWLLDSLEREGELRGREMRARRRDGTIFWISVHINPIREEDGTIRYIDSFLVDITDRKNAEQALAESGEQYRAVFGAAGDAILIVELKSGRILDANEAACRLYGYSREELLDMKSMDLSGEPDKSVQGMRRRLDHIPMRMVRHKSGKAFPVEISVSYLTLQGREVSILASRDITERLRMERMKTEFISTVAHELKTPVTSIHGALGLLDGGGAGNMDASARELVRIAANNSSRLIQLINDVLDLEKSATGRMTYNFEEVGLARAAEEAVGELQAYAQSLGVSIELDTGVDGCTVHADANRLTQILANLLSNAAKFSPSGENVRVRVLSRERYGVVEVEDHGPGIPVEHRDKVFTPFFQMESNSPGGSGLGLSIAKKLVEGMGGRIGFTSLPSRGSTFWFSLPLEKRISFGDEQPGNGAISDEC